MNPDKFRRKYVKKPENLAKLNKLISAGKGVNPIFMKGDLAPGRYAAMMKNYFSHYVKFRKYYS